MRRVISFLLSIVMVFSMLPVSAFAADVQTEETTAVTETVEQTTAPVTEATAEPSTETAMEPSEEAATEAQTEAATEAAEETVPEPAADQGTYVPTVSLADSDELLEGWLYRQFYGDSGASFFGVAASAQLNTYGKKLYDGLKTAIQAVAAGSQTSTVFEVDVSAASGTDVNDFQLDQVIDALLHDCPYELYWYDKTDFTTYQYTQTSDGVIYSIIVTMPVVADLRGSGYAEDAPVVDVTLATEAADAAAVAQEIVAANAGKSVYEKIVAFKGEICDLTSYNDEAAASMDFSTDADPWQLLWVFDGDASTTVVCEGYSKAFQYLCDLDGTIDCYTVTGVMTSPSVSGGHMWNIVTLNGANYLVDVTNSDSGTAGSDGSLFLNGGTGSVAEGYTFSTGGGNILFTYDDAMTTLWGSDGILVLSETAYDPDSVPEETEPEETAPEETDPVETEPVETEPVAALTGTCGDSAYWDFDEATGTLTISGTGKINGFYDAVQPWEYWNDSIRHIVVEEGITETGFMAFLECVNAVSLTLPATLDSIFEQSLPAAGALESIVVADDNTYYMSQDGVLFVEDQHVLMRYPAAKAGIAYTIPEAVTNIPMSSFESCSNLTELTFTGDAPLIDSDAFTGTTLTMYYPADNATWTSDVMQNYGGTLTWVSYGDAPVETEPAETEAPTYTLYFNNPLTGTVVAVAVKDGGTPEYVPAAETVAGYDFMGWFSGENGTGIQILDGDTWTSDMGTDWYAYYVESAADTLDQEQFLAALEEAAASDGNYYLTQNVTVSGELSIDQSVWIFVENGGSITVPADCTLTIGSNTHMVVTSGGNVTVNGTLNAYGDLPVQITAGILTVHENAAWNTTTGGVSVTLNSAEISVPDSVKAMLRAAAYPTDCASLEAAFAEGAAYAQIGVSVEGSIILDRDVEVPEQGQLSIANWSGVEESILTVSNGTTLTNYGYISVQDGCSLVVDASGKLVNYGYISVEGDGYVNSGIEENNGTIEVIRDITNVEELVAALAEAGAEASDSYYPTVYLNNALTLENGDTVTIPSYVTLMLNDCLTMESGSSLTIQQAATLMTGVYDADALIVNTGASMLNYGQLYLDAGYATFADGTYTQYQGGMVDLYPDATADGLDKGLIDYNISFSTAEELEQGLTQAQLGEYGSYTLSAVYGTASIALSGSYEIPANTAVDIYNGTNLELLSGTDVTNYGTIYLFSGAIMTIPEDALLTNNGAIYNYGGTINGTVTGNQPGTGGYNETITVSDPDSLKAELEADSGTDIYLSGEIALTANLTVNSSSAVCIPGGASLVVPSGKTLTVKSNIYIYGGSIVIEEGGKLAVSGDGWIQNMSGVITNEGTVTVSASSGGIWEYISYGASSTGIDKSKLHGIVFVQSTDDVLAGLAAAAEGYSMVEIVTEKSFALTESVTIPENVAFETTGFNGPVTVIIPWGVTLTNDGNVLIFENSTLLVRLGGGLVNNGYMEVLGTYTNNGIHSGGDPIVTGNGFVDIGAPECGGDLLTYDLENGVLTVSGTGDMYDYANEMAPWYDSDTHLLITEVVIEEGVTSIGHSAFVMCTNLEKVTVASTVTSIGGYAFQDCTALTEILFRGGVPEIDSTTFTGVTATAYYPGANATWTADKLVNYGGSLTWVPVYELDQTYLDQLIDNAPLNGDGVPMVSEDITIAQDAVLLRDSQVIFTGSITVPTGVTLTIQSEVLLAGQLLVEEGGAVVMENTSGSEWVSLVDVGGMQIDGTLTVGELCSFIVNDGAESVFGENSVVNNYGTFCAEWNGIIRSGGIINNYNFVNILNRMTVSGELNNFGYLNVEASGDGQLTIDGLLINHGEMGINAGSSVYVNGKLNNNGFINHFKAEDESVTGYFVVEGTLVNEQTGEMYLRDWVVVRNTVENYGYLYTSSMFHVESGVVKNLNRSVDKRGYLITENTSEFLVQGKLENSGDIEHFGYMEMDSGTADIGGTFYNHGVVGLGHFYGGTMNLTGTLYNEGELWVNHCVMDDVLYDGILNIDGELINTGMLGISGEANLNGALTNNGNATVAGETAVLAAAEGAVLNGDERVRLGTFGTLVNISDSNVVLQAEVTSEEELVWALSHADEHDYIDEQATITQSIVYDGVTGADNTILTELVVPDAVWLYISPEYGELVFPAGTKLINNGMINIDNGAALVIETDAELVNNSRIDVNDGWLIVYGQQSGEGTVGVPNKVTVTTEAELQTAVAMGVPNIYVQSAANYAARTVSELTLTKDLTIPAGTQVVMQGVNLVVPENITLAIEGSVVVTDGSNVTVNGALENSAVGETGLQLVSGSLTFGETGSYTAAAGAETAVGNDFVINSEVEVIPSDSVINLRWVEDFAYLQPLLTEAENGQPYRIQVNSSFPIEADVTVHANVELIISEGVTLSVPANIRLYNAGTITIQNGAELYINGQYSYVELDGILNVAEYGIFTTEFPAAESMTLCADGKTGSILLQPGREVSIAAVILPEEASAQTLVWDLIQETEVVSLDGQTLTALAEGTALLRVTATDGSGLTAELAITVSGYGIEITGDSRELLGGKSIKLEAAFQPDNLSDTSIVWSLAEGSESFATLKAKGNTATVTAADVSEIQTVTVVAESEDGEAAPAEYRLTIIPKARSITIYNNNVDYGGEGVLRDTTFSLVDEKENGFDLILRAEASPDGASNEVTWKSGNTKVAYFVPDEAWNAEGYVKLHFTATPGTTKITATAADGSKVAQSVSITTVKPVSVAAKGETELTLIAGKTATLKLVDLNTGKEIKPANIEWEITQAEDTMGTPIEAATVIDAKGKVNTKNVTAYEKLEVYGTAYVGELNMGSVMYTIKVHPKTTTVELYQGNELVNGKTLALDSSAENPSLQLSALQLPLDARNGISWKSSSEKIATVQDGVVTFAGKTGTVTITATADDSGKKATVKVEVGAMTREITAGAPAATLLSGKSMTLTAETVPAKPTKSGVTWTIIEGAEYAKVSGSKLTAKPMNAPRQVTLVATSKDAVKVVSNPVTVTILPKTAENLNLMVGNDLVTKTTLNAAKGDTFELSAWMFFSDLAKDETLTDVTWVSKKPAVATVSTGKDEKTDKTTVTVVGTGSTTITATGYNSDGKKVTATVTVKAGILTEGVKVTSDVFTVGSGKSITLKAETIPAKPTTKGVVWRLAQGDEAYAKISSSGKLTAAKGLNTVQEITVLVQAKDGNSPAVEIPVTITPLATGVDIFRSGSKVNGQTMEWPVDEELKLTARVYPFSGYGANSDRNANQTVTWKSSNSKILAIDAKTGEVTFGTKTGTVTITATANDGSGKKATFKVKTIVPIRELEIRDGVIAGGKTLKLSALITKINADATNKKLQYYISGSDGADFFTLTSSGELKTKKVTAPKTVQIFAFDDYGYVFEDFIVTITPATTKIHLDVLVNGEFMDVSGKTLELEAGYLLSVQAYSDPDGAYGNYTWKISNVNHACLLDEVGDENLSTFEGSYALVEGITPGKTVTLTATANDGSGKKATVKIKVVEPAKPQ